MYNSSGQTYIQAELLPPDAASVDWEHKPSPFKLYQNSVRLPLPYHLSQNQRDAHLPSLTLEQVGELLANSYSLLQQYYAPQKIATGMPIPQGQSSSLAFRRPVPSGGALFPCEIYLFSGARQALPAGIYHYDVAHHSLDVLQQCDVIETARSYLAHPGAKSSAYILALSCFFWKDGFKYGDFSYRLQGFDLGTIIAQCVAVLKQQAVTATVHYQFLDNSIDTLLGLDSQYESVYALITVDSAVDAMAAPVLTEGQAQSQQEMPTASQLLSIAHWPLVEAVHQAALITTREQFRPPNCLPEIAPLPSTTSYTLPPVDEKLALLTKYHQRHSANGRFIPVPIDMEQLAQFCYFSRIGYESDLDGQAKTLQHTLLYCVVNRIKEIPPGIYCYNPHQHTLELMVARDVRAELQTAQRGPILNVYNLSVCFFLVGDYNAGFHIYGDRWYRMQNMEAGMIVQRLYLVAAALQLGCRASLGFHQSAVRAFLQLPEHWHALIQVMVAPEAAPYGYYALPIHP